MATAITMPKLGLTMSEAEVVKWLKGDGEPVRQGEPVVTVVTAKIACEIVAPASGVLHTIAQPRQTYRVSETIGLVLEPGEAVPEVEREPAPTLHVPPTQAVPARATPEPPREVRSSPAARRLARELGIDLARVQGTGEGGRIGEEDVRRAHEQQSRPQEPGETPAHATPLAARMAEVEGLDLAWIRGTGPDGRIMEEDVLRVLQELKAAGAGARVVPLTAMRRGIADGMVHSLQAMAQLTLTTRADVTALVELRDALRRRWEARISYTDLIIKAAAIALREHPLLNSTWTEEGIVLHDAIDIGIAVALEQGLIVPVVRGADRRPLIEIHRAVEDLAERARRGALAVDEVTGGTFTITNLGMYGVETFTPIVNPPQSAILGVGGIAEELALRGGQVAARSRMALCLTIDHRVVDGAPGAAFLQAVRELLEQPALILA